MQFLPPETVKIPFLFLLTTAMALAQSPSPEANDPELQAIEADAKAAWSMSRIPGSPRERVLAIDAKDRQLFERGRAYMATHPSGPGKAQLVQTLAVRPPRFIISVDPLFDQDGDEARIVVDEAAESAAGAQLRAWLEEAHADRSLGPAERLRIGRTLARKLVSDAKTTAQFNAAQEFIEQLVAEGLIEPMARELQTRLINSSFILGAAVYEPVAARISKSAIESLRQVGAEFQAELDRQRDEMGALKFTAADGREVDLSKLRGKVVVVDFWATWCVPCVAELPALKKLYTKYRQNGFEIVGIALEHHPLGSTETAEQKAIKIEKVREALLAFTKKNEIQWPHYFDAKNPMNDIAGRFGVHLIPATFLIDQEGRLVGRNLHGVKLETEVKRLLAL